MSYAYTHYMLTIGRNEKFTSWRTGEVHTGANWAYRNIPRDVILDVVVLCFMAWSIYSAVRQFRKITLSQRERDRDDPPR